MNREIKFRAWDKRNDEMCEVISFQKPHVVVNCIDRSTIYMSSKHPMTHKLLNLEKVEIMQYTGLNDKNGIEIYENDIVQEDELLSVCMWINNVGAYAFVPMEIYLSNLQDKELINCVIFKEMIEQHGTDTFFENDIPSVFVKVIGNIHANKEFLT